MTPAKDAEIRGVGFSPVRRSGESGTGYIKCGYQEKKRDGKVAKGLCGTEGHCSLALLFLLQTSDSEEI